MKVASITQSNGGMVSLIFINWVSLYKYRQDKLVEMNLWSKGRFKGLIIDDFINKYMLDKSEEKTEISI